MDRFEDLLFGILNNNRELSDLVGRDTVGDYTIDTCYTIDQGYETAVWVEGGEIIIVQRYPNRELAEKGHKVWCMICLTKPEKIYSVQTEQYESFYERI